MCVCVCYILNIKIIYYYYYFLLLLTNTLKPDCDVSGLLMGNGYLLNVQGEKYSSQGRNYNLMRHYSTKHAEQYVRHEGDETPHSEKKLCPCIITVFSSNSWLQKHLYLFCSTGPCQTAAPAIKSREVWAWDPHRIVTYRMCLKKHTALPEQIHSCLMQINCPAATYLCFLKFSFKGNIAQHTCQ